MGMGINGTAQAWPPRTSARWTQASPAQKLFLVTLLVLVVLVLVVLVVIVVLVVLVVLVVFVVFVVLVVVVLDPSRPHAHVLCPHPVHNTNV